MNKYDEFSGVCYSGLMIPLGFADFPLSWLHAQIHAYVWIETVTIQQS